MIKFQVLFCIWILLLLSGVTLLTHKHKKRIKNIYIEIELVLPMYNAHPYFSNKNLSKKCALYMAKYSNFCSSHWWFHSFSTYQMVLFPFVI